LGDLRYEFFVGWINGLKCTFSLDPLAIDEVLKFHAQTFFVDFRTDGIIAPVMHKSIELCKNILS
jgi:hypothetical protein